MKYRLIAGTINHYVPEEGWENLHLDVSPRGIWHHDLNLTVAPDFVADLADLSFLREEMFDEVRAHHVLEHMSYQQAEAACQSVYRVLKPGGTFDVEVPDADRVCHAYVAGELDADALSQWLYGEQLPNHEPGDSHRYGHTPATLGGLLAQAGFKFGDRDDTGLALRYLAKKP